MTSEVLPELRFPFVWGLELRLRFVWDVLPHQSKFQLKWPFLSCLFLSCGAICRDFLSCGPPRHTKGNPSSWRAF